MPVEAVLVEAVLVEAVLVGATAVGAGLVDADAAGAGLVGAGAVCEAVGAEAVGAGAFEAGVVAAGAVDVEFAGEVETTTVVDLTSVVVQEPEVVALDAGAVAAGVLDDCGAAAGVVAEVAATVGAGAAGAGAAGAGAAGAVVELPVLDDTFEPAGVAGDGGEACLVAVTVVSRGAVTVESRRTVAVFDALRTLSAGRAGEEADRAVASRTCSIIAVIGSRGRFTIRPRGSAVPSDSRRSDDRTNAPYRRCCATEFSRSDHPNASSLRLPNNSASVPSGTRGGRLQ
ncbi:MAG TPA: hypothetical protein VF461_16135 [Gemmatimonadaceae bacterium]